MFLRLFSSVAFKNRELWNCMTKVNHPMYNDNRSVGISLPEYFDFFRISRWQYWHHKSTIENIQVENMDEISGTRITRSYHSHRTTLTHQYTLGPACVFKKHFLDSICKSGFVFLLQNNLYCRNSSICQSWSHHFGWVKEGRKNTIVTEIV